jgi:nicotinamidase-related amidase
MTPALLVIDLQRTLCEGRWAIADAAGVVARTNGLAQRARAAGVPVTWVQHAADDEAMRHGSAGWQLADGLDVQPGDLHVHKRGSDAFHETDLQALLQSRGVDTLVVCGAQSDFCVDSTVRRALALGFAVVMASDAISTLDNDVIAASQITAHHLATLANLESYGPRARPVAAADVRFD